MSTIPTQQEDSTTADLPGFVNPEPRTPNPTTSPTTTEPMTTRDGFRPQWTDDDDDELDPPTYPSSASSSAGSRSSTPTNGSSPVSTAEIEAGWAGIVTIGLTTAGLVANGRLAPGTRLWLMSEHDLASMAAPASRILARHVPVTPEKAGDLADAAEIAVGAAGYVVANFQEAAALRVQPTQPAQPSPAPDRAPPAPARTVATPETNDGGPTAPTSASEVGTFHDHYPPA
jgi:hypothetical protein